jgi:hypothetical protein
MADNPHFLFNNPPNTEGFRYKPRFPGDNNNDPEEEPNYAPMAEVYRNSINQFFSDLDLRNQERNLELEVPEQIISIDIEFFGCFDSGSFANYYRNRFGITPIKHYEFNKKVLFNVVDSELFEHFVSEIRKFIDEHDWEVPTYDNRIKFIKSFAFLTTNSITEKYDVNRQVVHLNLFESSEIFQDKILPIENRLKSYLREREIVFEDNAINKTIELVNPGAEVVLEISKNFDIIHAVNSASAGVIGPGTYGAPKRAFPFTISIPEYAIPTFGVIDTGVSDQTPLSVILVNSDNTFHHTGGNPLVDDADHGTGVAAFTCLGDRIIGDVHGDIVADSRILSIKVLDADSGVLTNSKVESLIRSAHRDLGVSRFVLTVNYENGLEEDSLITNYAYLLDCLTYELDILIFISTANYKPNGRLLDAVENYPNHFLDANTNLCSPAEGMNNITVGAIGTNFEDEKAGAISIPSDPSVYTRKYHVNYENLIQKNKKLFKPDILFAGGNYDFDADWGIVVEGDSAMQFLSSETGNFFGRSAGTSFSTPLIANIAAKIIGKYPDLRNQSVKALILNAAETIKLSPPFDDLSEHTKRFVAGNGVPNITKCLSSNENEITFILEDSIQPGRMKSFVLNLPQYLNELQKSVAVIEINATLCFKFLPLLNNHLAYCPIHMGFGVFKNAQLSEGNVLKNNNEIVVKEGWSQDGYYKKKMLSNSQKIRLTLARQKIIDEANSFRIAINCKLHGLLTDEQKEILTRDYEFSLVVRITENVKEQDLTGRLYNEIQLVNDLTVIGEIDLEGDVEV